MAQTREIKKRMNAVGTIQRITKTMQMIATAKFTAALQRTTATQPYTKTIRRLVAEVASSAGDTNEPLLTGPAQPVGRELVLVIGSDRGLCGAYNANVLRTAFNHVKDLRASGTAFDVETSGKKVNAFFAFQEIEVAERHTVGDKPAYEDVEAIANRMIEAFTEGRYDAIRVCYMRYESNARQIPELTQLLPMKADDLAAGGGGGRATPYEYSPSGPELLRDLLPLAVRSQLFQAFNDAVVSEQIMRMVAMKAATENAKELRGTLKRDFNRARQAQITTELTEIISGSAAVA